MAYLFEYSDLKSLLGLEEELITAYPALVTIGNSVTSAIEDHIGRDITSAERTESAFYGSSTRMISLRGLPITTVSTVTVTEDGTATVLTTDEYVVTGYGIKLLSPVEDSFVSVTYTGGFSSIPASIARAALLQTAYEFQSKEQIGASQVNTDGGSVSRPELGLLSEVKKRLKAHIHPLRWS